MNIVLRSVIAHPIVWITDCRRTAHEYRITAATRSYENILNDFNNTGNLGVSRIGSGEYFLPNGTMMCNLTGDFTYLRAVFINRSNNAYLGSGDIQSGVVISNISGSSAKDELNISINGIPVNAQNANILPGKYSSCSLTDKTIYNGILRYPTGCDNLSYSLITFDYNVNGSILPESALISPKSSIYKCYICNTTLVI